MSETKPMTDIDRRAFLDELDRAPISVTDWEAKFIESTIEQKSFSRKQCEVVDSLIAKYGERIGF